MTIFYVYIAGIIVCVMMSAFFSASEMSYSACSRVRLEHQRDNGDKKAGLAVRIRERFDDVLSTILVGNNITFRKQRLERNLPHVECFGFFVGKEGIANENICAERFEAFGYHGADHAYADQADLHPIVSDVAVKMRSGACMLALLIIQLILIKPFVSQYDLCDRIFCNGYGICCPRTEYTNAAR